MLHYPRNRIVAFPASSSAPLLYPHAVPDPSTRPSQQASMHMCPTKAPCVIPRRLAYLRNISHCQPDGDVVRVLVGLVSSKGAAGGASRLIRWCNAVACRRCRLLLYGTYVISVVPGIAGGCRFLLQGVAGAARAAAVGMACCFSLVGVWWGTEAAAHLAVGVVATVELTGWSAGLLLR